MALLLQHPFLLYKTSYISNYKTPSITFSKSTPFRKPRKWALKCAAVVAPEIGSDGKEDVLVGEEKGRVDVVDYDWTEEWYPLYLAKNLPDDAPLGLTVFDKQVVLFRDGKGEFHCYEDRCPHSKSKLRKLSKPLASQPPATHSNTHTQRPEKAEMGHQGHHHDSHDHHHHAVDGLVNLFTKANHDLTVVHNRLDKEFRQVYPDNANPMKLVSRIKKIQDELPSLKEQCRELLSAKQDLIDQARTTIVGNRASLQRLQTSMGIPITSDSDDSAYTNFNQVIDEWTVQVRSRTGDESHEGSEDINRMLFSAIVQGN